MSRFDNDHYDEYFNNQGEFWWANVQRALKGRKGQKALRELRDAMLALPEPKLISGRLATEDGHMCAVGVLAVHRRVSKGERREEVMRELAQLITVDEDGYDYDGDGDLKTAESGVKVGLTFALAWQLGSVNDSYVRDETDEQRYERVMRWIDEQLLPVPA